MKVKCSKCGKEIVLSVPPSEWLLVESTERNMGTEHRYLQRCSETCPQCNSVVEVELNVWEYPEGVFNMQDIEIKGGKLIEDCYLGDFLDNEK